MKLARLIEGLEGNVRVLGTSEDLEASVTGICIDSRDVTGDTGAGPVFAALPGSHTDGHGFVDDAVARGAVCVLAEKPCQGAPVTLITDDVRGTLSILSDRFYGAPSKHLVLVGVTGTNGKTTVSYLIESILRAAGFKTGLIGTVEHRWEGHVVKARCTTPEPPELHSILARMVDDGVTHCVMEVSSHALAQKRVSACAFNAGVFTNLSHDHLDFHRTMEEYYNAKKILFKELLNGPIMNSALINVDDEWGAQLIEELDSSTAYGLGDDATVHPIKYSFGELGIEASVAVPLASPGVVELKSSLVGEHNLYNILAAIGAGAALGVGLDSLASGVNALSNVPGRLERIECRWSQDEPGITAYVDYAHTPDALERTLASLRKVSHARIITVFGCGGNRDREKRAPMGSVAAANSDIAVITSDNPRDEDPSAIIDDICAGIEGGERLDLRVEAEIEGEGYAVIPDRAEAIRWAVAAAHPGDTILVAGKGHEDYQIVGEQRLDFDDALVLESALREEHGTLHARLPLRTNNG